MTQKCKWIKPNEVVEVQGIKLMCGGFYLGDRFVFDNIAEGVVCDAKHTSRFSIQPELEVSDEIINKWTSGGALSYKGLFKYERFLYLKWLSQKEPYDKLSSKVYYRRSQVIFDLYFIGLQIRMFVDGETSMEERLELLLMAKKLRTSAKQANMQRDLDEFIALSIAKFFINDNTADSPLDKSEIEENDRYKTLQIERYIEQKNIKRLTANAAFDICVNVLNLNLGPAQYTELIFKEQWSKNTRGLQLNEEQVYKYNIAKEAVNITVPVYQTAYSSHIILEIINRIHLNISRKFNAYIYAAKSFANQDFLLLLLPKRAIVEPQRASALEGELMQIVDKYRYASIKELFKIFGYIHSDLDKPPYKSIKVVEDALNKLGYSMYPTSTDDVRFDKQCLIYKKELQGIDNRKDSAHFKLIIFIMSAAQLLKNITVSTDARQYVYDYIDANCFLEQDCPKYYIYFEQLILIPQRTGVARWQIENLDVVEREYILSKLTSLYSISGNADNRGVVYLKQLYKRFGIKDEVTQTLRSEIKSNVNKEQIEKENELVSRMTSNRDVLEILIVAISVSRLTYSNVIKSEQNKFIRYIEANYSDPSIIKFVERGLNDVFSEQRKINSYYTKLIDTLDDSRKRSVLISFVKYYCTDKILFQGQINAIKKIFSIFGEQSRIKDFQNLINRICYEGEEAFKTIVSKESTKTAISVTLPTTPTVSTATLDRDKLAKIEQQTKDVHKILSEIFASEDDIIEEVATPQTSPAIELLKTLLEKECWARAEVEQLCQSRGVMLGAMLEQINDYAYEKIDDAVIEDDGDEIYVTTEYKDKLL